MELQLKLLACLIYLQMIGYRNLCIECVEKMDQKPISDCKVFLLWTSRMEGNLLARSELDATNGDFCYIAEEKCPEYRFVEKNVNLHPTLEPKTTETKISVCEIEENNISTENYTEHIRTKENFISTVANISWKMFRSSNKTDGYIELKLPKKSQTSDSYNITTGEIGNILAEFKSYFANNIPESEVHLHSNYETKNESIILKKITFFVNKLSWKSSMTSEEISSVNDDQFNIGNRTNDDETISPTDFEDLKHFDDFQEHYDNKSISIFMYTLKIKRGDLYSPYSEGNNELIGEKHFVEHFNIELQSDFANYSHEQNSELETTNINDGVETTSGEYGISSSPNEIDNDETVIDFPLLETKYNKTMGDEQENSSTEELGDTMSPSMFLFVIYLSATANDSLLNDIENTENITRNTFEIENSTFFSESYNTDTSQNSTVSLNDSTGSDTNETTELSNITEVIDNSTEAIINTDYINVTSPEMMNMTLSSSTLEENVSDETTIADTTTTAATTVDSCANPCIGNGLYGDTWTGCPGSLIEQKCPHYALGVATWYCDPNGGSFVGDMPEYSNCSHTWIDKFFKYILEGDDALWIASQIEIYSNFTSFFGHELTDLLYLLDSTFDLHVKQIENLIPYDKFSRSRLFTLFTTQALDKLLVSTAGMLQIPESQRVFVGRLYTNLSTSLGFTLASSAANVTENFNATFNSNTMVLFGVDVSDASSSNGTLVFPSEEGNDTGSSDMRSHISVDVGTHGEFKSPRSVGMLLDPRPASLLFPPSRNRLVDKNNASKILNSVLISFNLQDVDNGTVTLIENFKFRSGGDEYPVKIMLEHQNLAKGPKESVVRRNLYPGEQITAVLGSARCVFWNIELGEGGLWDETGCRVESSDETHTQCVCNHLSTFAVLMDVHDYVGRDATLEVLSWACTGASVICLILTLIVFQQCRSIQSERTRIGKNLCVCLVVGHLVALLFLDKSYINFSEVVCSFVAGALHYLFLASFCWMTVEGHHLYRMIVTVFDSGRDFRRWYLLVGYGIPGVIVLITKVVALARDEKAYGRDELCWLSSPFYIWSFIGPVLLLSTINTTVLILALREAVFAGLNQGKSKKETAWIWIRGWFSLSALLGITWVFGLAYMEFNHSFVYIFVVLNGCQGVFIFLFRCVLSEQVRSTVVSSVKRDGLTVLFRGFPYSRSSLNVDSTRSDVGHTGVSSIATGHSESVQDEGDSHALWYVLTHNIADRQLQEVVNTAVSCDLLQIHVKGTSGYGFGDEGIITKSNLASCMNETAEHTNTNSSCRQVANNTNIQQTINATKSEVDASFFDGGNWRPSDDADERINLSVFIEPCWAPLRSVSHVSVTRYPTIDEESDPDC